MGCCASKRRPPPQEAKPVDAGVAAYDVHFVDEKKEDPDEAADEAAVDVTFPNPSPQGKFEFELISGERVALRDVYEGTFAITESSARNDLIQEMNIKKMWVRHVIKTVMQHQNLTVNWREEGGRLYCKRKIELAGGKVKMGNEFEVRMDEWVRTHEHNPNKLIRFDTEQRLILEKQKLDSGAFNETELWFIDRETCITTGTIKQPDGTEKITYSKGVRVADIAAANKIRRRSTAYNGPARPRG